MRSLSEYADLFVTSFQGYARWLGYELTHPSLHNYAVWLVALTVFFVGLEVIVPWRKKQPITREGFWLDAFYLLFNFYLFSLIGYAAASEVAVNAFTDALASIGINNLVALRVQSLPVWAQLLTLFVLRDFIHWNVHRLLHRSSWLWRFHKVHHSVREMGVAAHLRYHWMETIVYRTLEYIPLAMVGFGIDDFFIVHIFALAVGHLNHSNLRPPLGPLRYIFNSPQMHIWHHAKNVPQPYGTNFGLTLSVWDWLFGTAYWPHDGRDEPLGFDDIETYPQSFFGQMARPFRSEPPTAASGDSAAE